MAMTYTGANGVFTQLGKILKQSNADLTFGLTTLATQLSDIQTILAAGNAGNKNELNGAFTALYGNDEGSGGYRSQVTSSWRSQIHSLMNNRLLDYDTVVTQLGLFGRNLPEVVNRLIDQMVIDSATVDKSTFTLGSVSAVAGNLGDGTLATTKVLDGVTWPGSSMPPHKRYLGLNSELCVVDSYSVECIAASQSGSVPDGGEIFRWYGSPRYDVLSWETEGAGDGPQIVCANSPRFSIVTNGDWETTGANGALTQFPGWNIELGTSATHVVSEASRTTSTSTSGVYRGAKSLRFDSTGSPPAGGIKITFLIDTRRLMARKAYFVGFWQKASASIADGDLTVQFEGTGYSAGASEKVNVAAASLSTTWVYKYFFVNMPAQIPTDGTFKLVIKWVPVTNLTSTKSIWFDGLAVRPVDDWFLGHAACIGGSFWNTPWKVGDRLTYAITTSGEKVFQKWFRQNHGVQLPSDASPSIADSLAT